jgi:hypothetical protein
MHKVEPMVNCPFTRLAYVALSVLLGFAVMMFLMAPGAGATATTGTTGGTRSVSSTSPQTVIVDPSGAVRLASQGNSKPAAPSKPKVFINFALASNGATAVGGQNAPQLIDGNESDYTGSTGYAMTQWNNNPPQFMLVTLKEPTNVGCVKFLLWDRSDERFYRYKLEVSGSETGEDWKSVADRSDPAAECKSWQVVTFTPQSVRRIRLTGTYNSANSGFHVVELQAFVEAPPPTRKTETDSLDF